MKDKIKMVNDLCAANGVYLNQHNKKTVRIKPRFDAPLIVLK